MIGTNIKLMIGLESHIQLKTESKLFCSCSTNSRGVKPNANTCEICLGFPGSKPALNEEALRKAIALAKILNCKVNQVSRFARKIYFYPDLPKGFQITQYEEPLAIKGEISIDTKKGKKTIRITRVHIEEDPGKIEYVGGHIGTAQYVLVDYNRSGLPLCEAVTEPDFSSIDEAVAYVRKLFHLLSYLDLIEPTQEGVMRTDANISINGGARVELKNISGSDALESALKAELSRQAFLVAQGKKVERETRMYSEETKTTILLRKKEFEEEYGYIREPDLLPVPVGAELIEGVLVHLKKLPEEVEAEAVKKYKLKPQIAHQLAFKRGLYGYFTAASMHISNRELLAKWLVGDFLKCANWHSYEVEQCPPVGEFIEFMKLIDSEKISEREGKELIKRMFDEPAKNIHELIGKKKIDVKSVVGIILDENKDAVASVRAGDTKAINFLVGQVLRRSNFKADPHEIRAEIKKQIR